MTDRTAETSPLIYARVAGFSYLLIIIIALLNGSFIDARLVVSGDDAATASNIMANDFLFRIGIAGVLIMYASVIVLSWALYVVLKTVNKNLALLALLFRSGEAVLGAATVLLGFVVLLLFNDKGYLTGFEAEQLQALAGLFLNVRTAGLDIVLLFVGLGGSVFCYLLFKSRYIPRPLAGWGIFTYVSMLVLSLVSMIFPNHPVVFEIVLYSLGGLFELVIGFWLLFKGVDTQQWESYVSGAQPMSRG
jgi:hypothetical protein